MTDVSQAASWDSREVPVLDELLAVGCKNVLDQSPALRTSAVAQVDLHKTHLSHQLLPIVWLRTFLETGTHAMHHKC